MEKIFCESSAEVPEQVSRPGEELGARRAEQFIFPEELFSCMPRKYPFDQTAATNRNSPGPASLRQDLARFSPAPLLEKQSLRYISDVSESTLFSRAATIAVRSGTHASRANCGRAIRREERPLVRESNAAPLIIHFALFRRDTRWSKIAVLLTRHFLRNVSARMNARMNASGGP